MFHAEHTIRRVIMLSAWVTSRHISMTYGRKANNWHVNSGMGWSCDVVDQKFGNLSNGDGSVPWRFIETITGGADLIGDWAIISYIRRRGGYGQRQASRIMRGLALPTIDQGVPYVSEAALDDHLDKRKARRREASSKKAEALNTAGPWVWRRSGPGD
jgi:hypothetical protein